MLDAIAKRLFGDANVLYQALDALRLHRSGLVAAPHGAVKRDVPLHQAGAQSHRDGGGHQADLVTGVGIGQVNISRRF